MKSLVSEVSIN